MKKILVIDDENDIVEIIKMALEDEGYDVKSASSGTEGLRKIDGFKPDLILLDIIMNDMDGMTMKKNMKQDIPVIVISACDQKTREAIEKEITVDKWIEKPFGIRELIEEIKKQLK